MTTQTPEEPTPLDQDHQDMRDSEYPEFNEDSLNPERNF